ncbi:hypothetical protein MmiAt1_04760 [Methanimicrococcus sp. At1]|uniref:Uncharacterized protein n=1 Tax=Methanimicrococcus hacksteinii TaxID=3028293 RepID=A0ABU3VNF4_9EURY|nr:hypothetical protein [Methanimicrococcus sp. At1]MDV0444927.1 hypothetical protein [Methanimicrococcus sp. At1]
MSDDLVLKNVRDIILFVFLLSVFIFFLLLNSFFAVLILLFGSLFYGFYSKSPIKSALLGFLFPAVFVLIAYLMNGSAEVHRIFPFYIILFITGSLSGLFAGLLKDGTEENQSFNFVCFFLSLLFAMIGLAHFISGIN